MEKIKWRCFQKTSMSPFTFGAPRGRYSCFIMLLHCTNDNNSELSESIKFTFAGKFVDCSFPIFQWT